MRCSESPIAPISIRQRRVLGRNDGNGVYRILSAIGPAEVVVAQRLPGVAEALSAGCDAIEQGYGMGEANLHAMALRPSLDSSMVGPDAAW